MCLSPSICKERDTGEGEEGLAQTSTDSLYVVECVKLDLQVEDEPLSLTKGACFYNLCDTVYSI